MTHETEVESLDFGISIDKIIDPSSYEGDGADVSGALSLGAIATGRGGHHGVDVGRSMGTGSVTTSGAMASRASTGASVGAGVLQGRGLYTVDDVPRVLVKLSTGDLLLLDGEFLSHLTLEQLFDVPSTLKFPLDVRFLKLGDLNGTFEERLEKLAIATGAAGGANATGGAASSFGKFFANQSGSIENLDGAGGKDDPA